jgi:hypothetical protein
VGDSVVGVADEGATVDGAIVVGLEVVGVDDGDVGDIVGLGESVSLLLLPLLEGDGVTVGAGEIVLLLLSLLGATVGVGLVVVLLVLVLLGAIDGIDSSNDCNIVTVIVL